jgi:hypothetical protein
MSTPSGPHQRCTARNQAGGQCRNPAVPGATVCRFHGGAAPQVQEAAQRRIALAEARLAAETLGLLIDISPEQALLDEVQRAAGMVAFYQARVEEIADGGFNSLVFGLTKSKIGGEDGGDTFEAKPNVWLELFNGERDRLVKVCAAALRAGIEERRVKLAEQQGILVAAVIRRILTRLNLSDEQAALVGTVVPEELRALTA